MTTNNDRGIGWVGVLVALFVILILAGILFNYWLAPTIFAENRDSGEQIARDSLDADKAVQDYREFRRLWFDIQSHREQLVNYQDQEEEFHETWGDDPKEWSRTAETRHGRIHDRITGERNQISRMVSDYNAMQSDATRAIFQCGLPYNIDEKLFIADATGVEYTSQEAMDMEPPEDPAECEFSGDAANSGASDTS